MLAATALNSGQNGKQTRPARHPNPFPDVKLYLHLTHSAISSRMVHRAISVHVKTATTIASFRLGSQWDKIAQKRA
jgi:hypothetical protein